MPLQLNFRIEDRAGVMVLVTKGRDDEDVVRPASSAEVELWNALTRRFAAPARESYIRVNEQDLVTVLIERDHLRRQVAELQRKARECEEHKAPPSEMPSGLVDEAPGLQSDEPGTEVNSLPE